MAQVGYGVVFYCSLQQAKEEMKMRIFSHLDDSELEAIFYSKNKDKIVWEEDGKEFLLDGKMYDVIRFKTINNDKIIYCISDRNETKLLEKYGKTIEENIFHGKKQKSVNFEQFIFCFYNENAEENLFVFSEKNIRFPLRNDFVLTGYEEAILQPPRN
jgi:hypothetical protein